MVVERRGQALCPLADGGGLLRQLHKTNLLPDLGRRRRGRRRGEERLALASLPAQLGSRARTRTAVARRQRPPAPASAGRSRQKGRFPAMERLPAAVARLAVLGPEVRPPGQRAARGEPQAPAAQVADIFEQLVFEILGGDFIQRTGRDLGLGNAQLLGLSKDGLAFDANFFAKS